MAWQLASPHTWCASVLPVLAAAGMAVANTGSLSVTLTVVLLLISVLMQSSVNTFNDYFDFVKGTDSAEDNLDPTDATLLYNNINPKSALALAIGYLAVAFALGIYIIIRSGWIPLVIAIIGALVVVLYSGGKTPVSYMPIGEFVSGFVMGGLITLASYQVLSGEFTFLALLWSLPVVIGISLIMATNNTCDIEKDIEASRKTAPVLLGRERARKLYRISVYAWIISMAAIIAIWFTPGIIAIPFMLLVSFPLVKALLANPLVQASRIAAMAQICSCNVALGSFYAVALFAAGAISFVI